MKAKKQTNRKAKQTATFRVTDPFVKDEVTGSIEYTDFPDLSKWIFAGVMSNEIPDNSIIYVMLPNGLECKYDTTIADKVYYDGTMSEEEFIGITFLVKEAQA
ncbi:hypothetical protein CLV62_12582 [Dysgonomonas alginatilytica]|uniref:Uncharacterized protein n=1 Tax=Dysgonomonas alginatilytica TaxID=1605892 RepID=A0A2V3PK16_9BACT|nr:hypothetical protein [Dysgonomonas alginatilytica]PXV61249.1 hypothetical protein CLV62_12582 [Dysgonomonas alginatilytica]